MVEGGVETARSSPTDEAAKPTRLTFNTESVPYQLGGALAEAIRNDYTAVKINHYIGLQQYTVCPLPSLLPCY